MWFLTSKTGETRKLSLKKVKEFYTYHHNYDP